MAINLRGRSFLKLLDFKTEEIRYLLDISKHLKNLSRMGMTHEYLKGKKIVLLFEKTSTRTRCAFESAAMDLGMGVTYLDPACSQMGKKESIEDTARVLGRMYDGIEYRGFEQSTVETLAKYAGVPVWNGLTNEFHPTQMLGDLLTIEEQFGRLKGLNLTFFGDARNNVGNSLLIACAKMGINFTACAPKELFPDSALTEIAEKIAKTNGATINFTEDVDLGAKNADIIYTDVWVSLGEADDVWEKRISLLKPYQVNAGVMKKANENAIFMHCLPSFHDLNTAIGREVFEKYGLKEMEVTDEVFESPQSVLFDEAENRMHTIKAVMYATLS